MWRLGLERVRAFTEALGSPQLAYPVFHVAGTNGKGSAVAVLDAVLRHAGLRVGRYTSPHLVDFRERIVVDGVGMPPEEIVAWLASQEARVESLGATFFEVTTAMAFDWFARREVDVAVIEVGLGGRLDATNVVQPVAAGVTSIGFDHMAFLGDTLERIAGEKGGIYKADVPAVAGETAPGPARVLSETAERVGAAPILLAGRDFAVREIALRADGTHFRVDGLGLDGTALRSPLLGRFQAGNAATALAMLHAAGGRWASLVASAPAALERVRLPGRFQHAGRWLFDVAHNPDGAHTIAATLRLAPVARPLWALVGVLADKDWRGILHALAPVVDGFVITQPPTSPASRAWEPAEAAEEAAHTGRPVVLEGDFDRALARASGLAATVLVTGSFHTVGDAMERLQVDPLAP